MRIIAGKYRGRKLKTPRGSITRPTMDRVRESLFNIIAGDIPGASILDLFAGSGAFGLETLSRGAASVVFVEKNKAALDALKENIATIVQDENKVMRVLDDDVFKALEKLKIEHQKFDVIFADPPYFETRAIDGKQENISRILLKKINAYDSVAAEGVIIIEHTKKSILPDTEKTLILQDRRTYGDTFLSFYHRME